MAYMDCHQESNQTPARAMKESLDAINAVHKAFGAPGDWGYGTKKGDALRWLYDSTALLVPCLKELETAAAGASE